MGNYLSTFFCVLIFIRIDPNLRIASKLAHQIIREVSFFTRRGLWKFFKFCKFLVIPYCMSKIFLIPPDVLQRIQVIPPHHLIIKEAKLVSVFEADIDHPLGLLKVKAGNLRGILIVVRVKLQNSHHINILYMTDKKFRRQLPLPWQQRDISISQLSDLV